MLMINQTATDTLISSLETLMAKRGWSNRQLSKKSGVSDRMIGKILNGESKPTIDKAEELAKAFGLAAWQLIMPDGDDLSFFTDFKTLSNNKQNAYRTLIKDDHSGFDTDVGLKKKIEDHPQHTVNNHS